MSKHTILYAEDDADDFLMVLQAFEKHRHVEIIHAINGLEALGLLDNMLIAGIKPCLVILDINMPKMDGRETLQRLKRNESQADIPVILFTTSSNEKDRQFAEKHEAKFMTKPLQYKDLEEIALVFLEHCNFEINKLNS